MLFHLSLAAAEAPDEPDEATKLAARQLAQEGLELLRARKYAEAQDRLHRAYEIVPAPTVALLEGRALEKLGKLVEAAERYQLVKQTKVEEDTPEAFKRAAAEAAEDLKRVRPLIPQVIIVLEGIGHETPGFEVSVDGVVLPPALFGAKRPVNPGKHEIVAMLDGKEKQRREVNLKPRQHERVVLNLGSPGGPVSTGKDEAKAKDEEPADEFPYVPVAWGSVGVGGAGLVVGGVSLIVMLKKESTLDEHCPNQECPEEYRDDLRTYRTARTATTVGFVVGAVGVGAGFTLLLLAPEQSESANTARLSAWLGPGQVGLRGSF